jgi:predicted methyltransferase
VAKGVMSAAVIGVGALFAYQLFNAPRSVRPGINAPFADASGSHEFVQRFEVESREIFNKMQEVVNALEIQPGQNVADLGAGTGLFIEALARAVSSASPAASATGAPDAVAAAAVAAAAAAEGTVLALDPYPKFVSHMRARVAALAQSASGGAALASRVTVAQNDADCMGTSVAPSSLDLVLCTDAYHHFEYPGALVASVFRALRPGGRFAVLDFKRIPGESSEWVLGHVRAGQDVVRKEIEEQGFVLQKELQDALGLKENYLMIFVKKN